jgi:hypothetical protein
VPVGGRGRTHRDLLGFHVEIVSDDERAGREIARRATALWP